MDSDRLIRLKHLLLQAGDLPEGERETFLDQACHDDPELRREVALHLVHDGNSGDVLTGDYATSSPQGGGSPPDRIAGYRILSQLGEGGMGVVYLAEQAKPIRRRVALKIIKVGMDTRQVVARFEIERQALAMMNHAGIAKVFDAGTTDQGRPFFVMEHVPGIPITDFCDKHRLTTRQRLELFARVCQAIHHAHQKGIIHRDIKPSNVLISYQEGKPAPKVIDFGVAKATSQRLTERTVFTEQGQLIGTPEYMSPEQAEMTGLDVDTTTDVYSLGVLLYELLTGALPFDPKALRRAGLGEIQRRIREDEPPKPSTRVSTQGEVTTGTAQRRQTTSGALCKQLRGDLDWIVMCAIEKDQTRRYASASEFAADIGRYLEEQPVVAGPPSTTYRARKFIRRHRVAVSIAVAAFLFLAGFAVRERSQANLIARERDRVEVEMQTADQVSEFLVGLFKVSDPGEARGNSVTAREILDRGAEEIDETLVDQPEVRARLMATMGDVYRNLGLYDEAGSLLEASLSTCRSLHGDDDPDVLATMSRLAIVYRDQDRHDEAEALLLEAVEAQKLVLGVDHPATLSSMNNLAGQHLIQGRYDEAESLYIKTLKTGKRVLGDDHDLTLTSINNLALLYEKRGRYEEAEPLYVEALQARRRVLGEDHPDTLSSMNKLGGLYWRQGLYDEAESLFYEALQIRRRVLGEDHKDTLVSMIGLGVLYKTLGRTDEAETMYLEAVGACRRVLGDDHRYTMNAVNNLAILYKTQHRYDEAEVLCLESLQTQRHILGEDHPDTLSSMSNLGALHVNQGRYDEAESLIKESLQAQRRVLGGDHTDTIASTVNLAVLYTNQGRYDAAMPLFLEALNARKRVLGDDHPITVATLYSLACCEALRGDGEESLNWLSQAVEAGFADADSMATDSNLESLHDDPTFQALVARARATAGSE